MLEGDRSTDRTAHRRRGGSESSVVRALALPAGRCGPARGPPGGRPPQRTQVLAPPRVVAPRRHRFSPRSGRGGRSFRSPHPEGDPSGGRRSRARLGDRILATGPHRSPSRCAASFRRPASPIDVPEGRSWRVHEERPTIFGAPPGSRGRGAPGPTGRIRTWAARSQAGPTAAPGRGAPSNRTPPPVEGGHWTRVSRQPAAVGRAHRRPRPPHGGSPALLRLRSSGRAHRRPTDRFPVDPEPAIGPPSPR